jgi:putative endonuclease
MYYVYILTNEYNNVLYTGITNDLIRRIYEHKNELVDGFTKRYHVHKLVYYECFDHPADAIAREKSIKGKTKAKKIALIEQMNPSWAEITFE